MVKPTPVLQIYLAVGFSNSGRTRKFPEEPTRASTISICAFGQAERSGEKSSPVVIKVRSSCIHKVNITICCFAALYVISIIFSSCFGFIAYDFTVDKYILFDGLTYNTREYFASCVAFFRAPQRRGKIRVMSKMSASIIC